MFFLAFFRRAEGTLRLRGEEVGGRSAKQKEGRFNIYWIQHEIEKYVPCSREGGKLSKNK